MKNHGLIICQNHGGNLVLFVCTCDWNWK